MRRGSCFTISNFVCPDCGLIIPLPRCHGQQRGNGHKKNLWCPTCKEEHNFMEIKYKESYRTMAGDVIMA